MVVGRLSAGRHTEDVGTCGNDQRLSWEFSEAAERNEVWPARKRLKIRGGSPEREQVQSGKQGNNGKCKEIRRPLVIDRTWNFKIVKDMGRLPHPQKTS